MRICSTVINLLTSLIASEGISVLFFILFNLNHYHSILAVIINRNKRRKQKKLAQKREIRK
jgi:hypothetical protein